MFKYQNKIKIPPLQISKKIRKTCCYVTMIKPLIWRKKKQTKKNTKKRGKFHFQILFCSGSSSILIYIVFEDVLYLRSTYHWPSWNPRIFLAVLRVRPQFPYCVISGSYVQTNKFLIHFPKTFLCKRCGYPKLCAYLLPSEPPAYSSREKMRRKAQY